MDMKWLGRRGCPALKTTINIREVSRNPHLQLEDVVRRPSAGR
jgi:hypothetical protein